MRPPATITVHCLIRKSNINIKVKRHLELLESVFQGAFNVAIVYRIVN